MFIFLFKIYRCHYNYSFVIVYLQLKHKIYVVEITGLEPVTS